MAAKPTTAPAGGAAASSAPSLLGEKSENIWCVVFGVFWVIYFMPMLDKRLSGKPSRLNEYIRSAISLFSPAPKLEEDSNY